jgi:PST family polysaccharide transporter
VLALIGMVSALLYYNDPILMALGKPHWCLRLIGLSAVVNFIFFVIAVRWGTVGVAAAFVLRGYLMLPILLWVVNKVLPFKWTEYFQQCRSQLIAALVMVSTVLGFKYVFGGTLSVQVLLLIYVALGAITYGTTIVVIAPQLPVRFAAIVRYAVPQPMLKMLRLSTVK